MTVLGQDPYFNADGSFSGLFGGYTSDEFKAAAIGLIPVAGKRIKFQNSWIPYLQAARNNAADTARAAQEVDALKTEADKAADVARKKAQKASGRAATILTSPLGVSDSGNAVAKTLLGS